MSGHLFKVLAVLAVICATDRAVAHETPNIVIILADDFGYGDSQPLNPESTIPTPALNRLAAEGMTFTDAHTPSAVCSPTRYGLVCGRYAWRTRLKQGVLGGYSAPLIDADRQTIADVAKSAGYRTAVVGKWHLGLGWQWNGDIPTDVDNFGNSKQPRLVNYDKPLTHGPFSLGFDQSFLIPASLDMTPYVYVDGKTVEEKPTATADSSKFPPFWRGGEAAPSFKHVDVLDRFIAQAEAFITQESDEPFFLYMPFSSPHKPVIPHPRYVGKSGLGPYGDFIVQTDAAVGSILNALDKSGQADNTLIFFTSDNGSFMVRAPGGKKDHLDDQKFGSYRPEHHRPNGLLRGTKADIYEAGHRVPLYARWPEHIASGTYSQQTVCLTDLLRTVADITGVAVESEMAEDSTSFTPILLGQSESINRPNVINHSAAGMFAVREGDWKLILGDGSGGRENPKGKRFNKPYQLYNLANDLAESKDVSAKHPEVVARLEAAAWEIIGDDAERP